MNNPLRIAHMLIRGSGALLLVLGIPIWIGKTDGLIPLHVLFGVVLVLSLWTLAYLASQAGLRARLVALTFLWGLLAALLGLSQGHLVDGNAHWLIQVLHLLVGVGAIGLGEGLAVQIKGRATPVSRDPGRLHSGTGDR
jgi:hypothetical protein